MDAIKLLAAAPRLTEGKHRVDRSAPPASAPKGMDTVAEGRVADLKKGAKAFEAYFVQSLLKEMRKTVKKEGEGQLGYGGEIYQSLFDEAIATKMTETGGIGLAEVLVKNLSKKP